jgi:integrase
MWLSKQMGHADIEMIMRTYGKWIPDSSIKAGYRPVNNWGNYLEKTNNIIKLTVI